MPLLVLIGLAHLAATLPWLTNPTSDFWTWTERLSWAVIILGFPAAIWQLALLMVEQRRVARELTQRADLLVFFEQGADANRKPPIFPKTCVVKPEWTGNAILSEPVDLHILVLNQGERTGHDPLFNVTFPPGIDGPIGERTLGSLNIQSLVDPAGQLRLIGEQRTFHPGVLLLIAAQIRFPNGILEVPVIVAINVSDRRPSRTRLLVKVDQGAGA